MDFTNYVANSSSRLSNIQKRKSGGTVSYATNIIWEKPLDSSKRYHVINPNQFLFLIQRLSCFLNPILVLFSGHVDPGESDWVTALRETQEEAGLSENEMEVIIRIRIPSLMKFELSLTVFIYVLLQIYKDISKTLDYKVKGKPKTVVYWLAKLKNPDQKINLSEEHQDLKWLPLQEAQEISGYDDMNMLLQEFHEKAQKLL